MIKATLRYLHSPDVPDLESFLPAEPQHFGILVQAFIGSSDTSIEESFDFMVCTPDWLSERLEKEKYLFGRHYLFVQTYNYQTIWQAISGLCGQFIDSEWVNVAQKIGRYGYWEFEDQYILP